MADGWIKTHRKVMSHWLYQEKPFDRYHAWEDLLLSAGYEQTTSLHGNNLLTVERGQLVTSLRALGKRWGWNQEKVRRFLNLLVSDAMIKVECDTTKTLISIENWDFYQSLNEDLCHDCDTTVTRTRHPLYKKNIKNIAHCANESVCEPSGQSVEELFASLWKLYPEKKGKAHVSKKSKLALMDYGYDQIARCIERYRESKLDWQQWQYGSTFFNSGYVDYLDENFDSETQRHFVRTGTNEFGEPIGYWEEQT